MKKPDSSNGHSDDFSLTLSHTNEAIHKMSSRLGDLNSQYSDVLALKQTIDALEQHASTIDQKFLPLENLIDKLTILTDLQHNALSDELATLSFNQISPELLTARFKEVLDKSLSDALTKPNSSLKDLTAHTKELKRLLDSTHLHITNLSSQLESSSSKTDANLQLAIKTFSQQIMEANSKWHRLYLVTLAFIALLLLANLFFYLPSLSLFNHSPQTNKTPQNQPLNQSSDSPSPSVSDDQHKPASSTEEPKKNPSHNSKKQP